MLGYPGLQTKNCKSLSKFEHLQPRKSSFFYVVKSTKNPNGLVHNHPHNVNLPIPQHGKTHHRIHYTCMITVKCLTSIVF